MTRILHLVRTALPEGVVGPQDKVVYTADAQSSGSAPHCIWVLDSHGQTNAHITSAELCELVFKYDSIAVW